MSHEKGLGPRVIKMLNRFPKVVCILYFHRLFLFSLTNSDLCCFSYIYTDCLCIMDFMLLDKQSFAPDKYKNKIKNEL